ncbi:uncharacterized protein LOC142827362 [Pelodiscus sinensis]|uniref:uncharacterized protein LOC142827362 n=1 Tax=Pelodiscus sinensis TaxID=13735 RepID=UPI003F6B6366
MSQGQAPPNPSGPSRESSPREPRGSKRRAPSWSGPDIKALLGLWAEEESLQAMHSTKRQNADIFARMAEDLAKQGHHPRTLEQVRAKVKELRQGYVRAREQSSRSGEKPYSSDYYKDLDRILGAGDPLPPERLLESGLEPPVVQLPEHLLGDQELQEEADEEEDGTQSTQEPGLETQEASQTTSDPGEGTSAGPADQEGGTPPARQPRQPQGTRRHWRTYLELVRQHVGVLHEMKDSMERRLEADAKWHRQLLLEFRQQHRDICAAVQGGHGLPWSFACSCPSSSACPFLCSCPLLSHSPSPTSCSAPFCGIPHAQPGATRPPEPKQEELGLQAAPSALSLPPPFQVHIPPSHQ